jgi:hypothetical protein
VTATAVNAGAHGAVSLVEAAPSGARWLHDMKWDGYRLVAHRPMRCSTFSDHPPNKTFAPDESSRSRIMVSTRAKAISASPAHPLQGHHTSGGNGALAEDSKLDRSGDPLRVQHAHEVVNPRDRGTIERHDDVVQSQI